MYMYFLYYRWPIVSVKSDKKSIYYKIELTKKVTFQIKYLRGH